MVGIQDVLVLPRAGTGWRCGMKQEKYGGLIKQRSEYLAKAMKFSKSGNVQTWEDKNQEWYGQIWVGRNLENEDFKAGRWVSATVDILVFP